MKSHDITPHNSQHNTTANTAKNPETPYPYPRGWYAVAFSHELSTRAILTRDFMGQQLILWRQRSGVVHASNPYCPHLGNHFGANGLVHNEELECGFHGWRFNGSGMCTFAPRGEPPRSIKPLAMYPVQETCGVILVFHDPEGADPEWHVIPPADQADRVWRPLRTRTIRLNTHVQEVGENSVDLAHLEYLHRFDLTVLTPTQYDGARAHTVYGVKRPVRRFPWLGRWLWAAATFDIHATGLGFNIGDIHVRLPLYRCTARLMMLPTPIDENTIELRVSSSLRRTSRRGFAWLLSPLLELYERIAERVVMRVFMLDILRDARIWEHKTFFARPTIASHDGPIGKYRKWTRQFYPHT